MRDCADCGSALYLGESISPRRYLFLCDNCRRARKAKRMREYSASRKSSTGKTPWQDYRPKKSPDACSCGAPLRHGARCRACGILDRQAAARAASPIIARRRRAEKKLTKASEGLPSKPPLIAFLCWRCGEIFLSRKSVSRYCSSACKDRDAKARRRALTRGVKITPGRRYEVFVRDGWICQICLTPVERDSVAPAPLAPTIDHRVALANGGEHGPDNWQTAHSICNSRKRDLVSYTEPDTPGGE